MYYKVSHVLPALNFSPQNVLSFSCTTCALWHVYLSWFIAVKYHISSFNDKETRAAGASNIYSQKIKRRKIFRERIAYNIVRLTVRYIKRTINSYQNIRSHKLIGSVPSINGVTQILHGRVCGVLYVLMMSCSVLYYTTCIM